jgi:hypothetical protein
VVARYLKLINMLISSRFKFTELNIFTLRLGSLNKNITYIMGPAGVVRITLPFYYVLTSCVKNNFLQLHFFYPFTISSKELHFSRAFVNLMLNRVCFQNYLGLKTIGIGYRFIISPATQYLFIAVGLTHLLVHRLDYYTKIFKIKKKKRLLILTSCGHNDFTNECKLIRHLRPPDVYCGKGLRLFHERFKLKEGKKQVR